MSIYDIILEFSVRETAPVEVDDVVDFIRRLGIKDHIFFFEDDFDPGVLVGTINHWEYPDENGTIVRCVDIYTAKSLSDDERRFVQVKELLHIVEPEAYRANSLQEVKELIDKIVLPPDLVDFANDGVHANSDRVAILHAIAVMIPMAIRDLFMAPVRDGKVDHKFIADIVDVPVKYVAVVMSDFWSAIHTSMIEPARIPDKVMTLGADRTPIELHSVPLGADAYSYAKSLSERSRGSARPIAACIIERRGVKRTMSAADLAAYSPRNGSK